ncbi:IclR family transcriptional regulator C-terminal domain-containing protein [Paeniglutamicibacter sp. ABSL32-1]|uniref:IclR family transcriptional regulator C-terminal domain-containing protein n=1 Tax=Paeniglutamicibacter quisquiliarum TaxID=2849498 RepID=UPI001C2D81B3|nr:IclR family transcriptional regulator C-terminal domain-containing protein [Paeniglutamicibacter quisquiliarum]MBV1777685.1 IclR family transcriptional regulator C-terminal domain-containing protein [Paeniglutamicibacter quisquiliarum]
MLPPVPAAKVQGRLLRDRELGYALNFGLTEPDLGAVGAAVGQLNRPRVLALSLSAPISRAEALQRPDVISNLLATCRGIRNELNC